MGLSDEVSTGDHIALDSDSIIYFVEQHPRYLTIVKPLMQRVSEGEATAHVSTISLTEVLVKPLHEHRQDIADSYRSILTASGNLVIHPVDLAIAERAAQIRAEHQMGLADAVVAATAIEAECRYLITNNRDHFKKLTSPALLIVDDYVAEGAQN